MNQTVARHFFNTVLISHLSLKRSSPINSINYLTSVLNTHERYLMKERTDILPNVVGTMGGSSSWKGGAHGICRVGAK